MRVLRSNKDSVMAMLEAFVHDPLINWRLLNTTTDTAVDTSTPTTESGALSMPRSLVLPACSSCVCSSLPCPRWVSRPQQPSRGAADAVQPLVTTCPTSACPTLAGPTTEGRARQNSALHSPALPCLVHISLCHTCGTVNLHTDWHSPQQAHLCILALPSHVCLLETCPCIST